MGYGSFLSVLFHVCVFALAVLGLPRLFDPEPVKMGAVAVEIASLSELEAIATPPGPEPAAPPPPPAAKAAPPAAPPLPPSPELAIPAPRPVPPEAAPAPAAVPEPRAKPLVPEAVPAPAPRPKPPPPKIVKKAVAKPPPRPVRKPRPPDRMQTVLKNLDRIAAPVPKQKPAPDAEKAAAVPEPSLQERFRQRRRGDEIVIIAELRRQLEPCWSIPAGGKDVAGIRVPIRIRLQPDGSLAGRPAVEDTARLGSDQMYRTVAESALRALRDPRCVPFRLPYGQYEIWKDVVFSFDPKEMLGE